ncbi:hypothetical protein P355_4234 [Burkholderia cenocepacia KC-01]|nr:hypothetical protein P355_4234 [Burkholderia cenocepacia KC-01]
MGVLVAAQRASRRRTRPNSVDWIVPARLSAGNCEIAQRA